MSAPRHDFADTAALVKNLDVVVSVDTAVAHLAAALAVPTVVMLPFAADFRWLRERFDSQIADLLGDLPLTVTSFRAEQGRMVLEGVTKPAAG